MSNSRLNKTVLKAGKSLAVIMLLMLCSGCNKKEEVKLYGAYQCDDEIPPTLQISIKDNLFTLYENSKQIDYGRIEAKGDNFIFIGDNIDDVAFDATNDGFYLYYRSEEYGNRICYYDKKDDVPIYHDNN